MPPQTPSQTSLWGTQAAGQVRTHTLGSSWGTAYTNPKGWDDIKCSKTGNVNCFVQIQNKSLNIACVHTFSRWS